MKAVLHRIIAGSIFAMALSSVPALADTSTTAAPNASTPSADVNHANSAKTSLERARTKQPTKLSRAKHHGKRHARAKHGHRKSQG